MIDTDPAVAPTITGTVAGQATTSEMPINPFASVTIGDANNGGTNVDTLTVTLFGSGTLSGAGSVGVGDVYTLTGTATQLTGALHATVFTPVDGVPNTSATTGFALNLTDPVTFGTASDSATTVIDTDPAQHETSVFVNTTGAAESLTGASAISPMLELAGSGNLTAANFKV